MEPTHDEGETASSPAISPSLIVHLRDSPECVELREPLRDRPSTRSVEVATFVAVGGGQGRVSPQERESDCICPILG